ncbi:hypothetical protein POKO110462_14165 [Pontibacter korlensis]
MILIYLNIMLLLADIHQEKNYEAKPSKPS